MLLKAYLICDVITIFGKSVLGEGILKIDREETSQ